MYLEFAPSHIIVRPIDDPVASVALAADPLATFLTARWAFHETHRGRTIYCRNHHEAWPLQPAELVHLDDGLLAAAGFDGLAHRFCRQVVHAPQMSIASLCRQGHDE